MCSCRLDALAWLAAQVCWAGFGRAEASCSREGLCTAPCLQVCTAAPFLDLKLNPEGTQALEQSAWERDGVALEDMIIAVLGSARLTVGIYDLGGLSNLNNSTIPSLWPC